MEHDEIYEDTWEAREKEWLPSVQNNVSSTAFCYARYKMRMGKSTDFGVKNSFNFTVVS